ncbi:MAG: hypothetical protein R2707_05450 [Acidimicrobiales bacterium]
MRRPAVLLILPFLLAAALVVTACGDDPGFRTGEAGLLEADPDLMFVVPAGAGEAFDAGDPLEILPARLEVSVGDVIEIRNDDDRGHLIGPFFVGEGEVLRQEFTTKGEFIGGCTVHPSGQIVVVVS